MTTQFFVVPSDAARVNNFSLRIFVPCGEIAGLISFKFPRLRGIADRVALPAPFLSSSVLRVKLVSSAYILESKMPRGRGCICVYVYVRGGVILVGVTGAWRAAWCQPIVHMPSFVSYVTGLTKAGLKIQRRAHLFHSSCLPRDCTLHTRFPSRSFYEMARLNRCMEIE